MGETLEEIAAGVRTRLHTMTLGAVAGIAVPVLAFATLVVVGSYAGNFVPGVNDAPRRFVTFYEENFTKIRLSSTLDLVTTGALLVFLVALTLAAARRIDVFAVLAIVFATAGTAVTMTGRGLFVSPTVVVEMTRDDIARNLSPETARFLVLVPDTMADAGGVAYALGFLALTVVLLRSELAGRWFLGVTAALMGIFGTVNLLLGGGGGMMPVVAIWALVAAILLIVSRRRLTRGTTAGRPSR